MESLASDREGAAWCRLSYTLAGKMVMTLPAMWEARVLPLGHKDLLKKDMETHSSILAWKIPWTEEQGGLQSMGSQRVRHG